MAMRSLTCSRWGEVYRPYACRRRGRCFGHTCRGALAVGAGDVDDAERLLRMAHDVEDHLHALQVEIGGVAFRWTAHDVAFDVDHAFVVAIGMFE